MYEAPLVLGVDCTTAAPIGLTLAESLANLGQNTGNMLFAEGLFRSVKSARRSDYHITVEASEGIDVIVVSAANWINDTEDFGWLFNILEMLNLPVVLVGIGVQTLTPGTIPNIPEGTLKLIKLAASRSAYIGVRGSQTAYTLRQYGIDNVKIVGCPSLLAISGSSLKFNNVRIEDHTVLLHSTRHQFDKADRFNTYLYRQAFDRRLNIVLQSELADMYFTLGRTNNKEINAISGRIISECYGSDATEVAKYLTEKGHVFFDYDTWLAANTQYSLAVGTRMHGAIAALISGVPSVLICHDDRTRELAEVMPLPHVMADALDMSAPLDFHKLSGLFDSEQVHDKYAVYRSNYLEFMRLNGLQLKD